VKINIKLSQIKVNNHGFMWNFCNKKTIKQFFDKYFLFDNIIKNKIFQNQKHYHKVKQKIQKLQMYPKK